VGPGQAIASDGIVVLGDGLADEAMLTGESMPVKKEIGTSVFGGTILQQGSVVFELKKLPEDAAYNKLLGMVENA